MTAPQPKHLVPRDEESILTERLTTLQKILDEAHPEPRSEGERIAWTIYTGALQDTIKTLHSLIEYRKAKTS